jgi:hypothetical protein
MKVEAGKDYTCELQVKAPVVGKVKIRAVISVDSDTTFYGKGELLGKTVRFHDGAIRGDNFVFSVVIKSIRIDIVAQLRDDGSIEGTAVAAKHKPMHVTGHLIRTEATPT